MASASPRGATRHVRIGDVCVGDDRVRILAGPCAVEDGYVQHAMAAATAGASVIRGCILKPRTSPDTYQGMGRQGLNLLEEARQATGLPILAEPLEPADIAMMAGHVQALLIGTRSMHNTPLLRAAGRSGLPVVLKRGMVATYDEWLKAARCIEDEGNPHVILCERGIRTFETATRNTLDISAIAVLRERTDLPIIIDPSHSSGRSVWVAPLAVAAVAAGADGLLIECHPQPELALCDAAQAILPSALRQIVTAVRSLEALVRTPATATMTGCRDRIDAIDDTIVELVEQRIAVIEALHHHEQTEGETARHESSMARRVRTQSPGGGIGAERAAQLLESVQQVSFNAAATHRSLTGRQAEADASLNPGQTGSHPRGP